ncbi:MAG: hypothetical protein C4576_25525 [Desulfobacteraceae bacterium]|nr:MAG: hypothetical protein C4576_25525 [Desulfobacteraceae bacterium]
MWEAILAVSLVVLGWGLNQWTVERNEKRKERRLKGRVRSLLKMEIGKDLEGIKGYWDQVRPQNDDDEFSLGWGDLHESGPLVRIKTLPIPLLSDSVWKSQLERIPVSLNEDEIRKCLDFYEKVTRVKADFKDFWFNIFESTFRREDFLRYYEKLSNSVEALVNTDNPLGDIEMKER